jgi:large subunit ribosomal protein L29
LQHTNFLASARSFQRLIWKAVHPMKTNKYVEELKAKSAEELSQELVSAKKELFNLRFQNATNQLDNTARIKEVRKNIARIQTVITQNAAQ